MKSAALRSRWPPESRHRRGEPDGGEDLWLVDRGASLAYASGYDLLIVSLHVLVRAGWDGSGLRVHQMKLRCNQSRSHLDPFTASDETDGVREGSRSVHVSVEAWRTIDPT